MSDAAVNVEVLVTAEVPMPDAYVFRPSSRLAGIAATLRPGDAVTRAPCLAFVVHHPDAGTILIYTGMHPDVSESITRDFGRALALMFRGLRPAATPYAEQLREHGVDPAEIERVVMTHLHADHTSGMRLLPRAEFICSTAEWSAATGRFPAAGGFVSTHLPPRERTRLLDFEAEGRAYGPFSQTIDLLGDGSIRLLSTPGHTPGHLSVLLRVGDGWVLLVGDALYTLENMRREQPPLLTTDDGAYMRSLRELKTFAESEPDAILVPTHDPDAWRGLTGTAAAGESAARAS